MELITSAEFTEIRSAIQDVADTFFKTPILYKLAVDSLDEWQEERKTVFTEYNLLALYEDTGKEIKEYLSGSSDNHAVKLTFLFDDLKKLGITRTNGGVIFNPTTDFIIVRDLEYKIRLIKYDGPLQEEPVLIIVIASLSEKEI